jgi:hypothetical protein
VFAALKSFKFTLNSPEQLHFKKIALFAYFWDKICKRLSKTLLPQPQWQKVIGNHLVDFHEGVHNHLQMAIG